MKPGQHKLSNEQVVAIFHDLRARKAIAAAHNISEQMISKIKKGQAYMELTSLPSRRSGITTKLEHRLMNGEGLGLHITAGLSASGKVIEVFCANPMKGSDLDALLTDGSILISLLLRAGISLAVLSDKLCEVRPESGLSGPPASPLGTIIRGLMAIEEERP